jgi:gluconokinase
LRWLEVEGAPGGTDLFVGIKTWVLHRLTGRWALDRAMASTTGLLDIRKGQWDEQALALGRVSDSQLPPLVAPTDRVGVLQAPAAAATGLPAGLPIIAGAHDGGLANIGAGADLPGAAAISVGTSGAMRIVTDAPQLDSLRRSWCYLLLPGRWLVGGAINNGGLAMAWARDQFYNDVAGDWQARTRQLMDEAERAPVGAGNLLFLPYLAGERTPHWDSSARATLHGLTLAHGRAEVARAVLESVAYCLRDVWEVLQEAGVPADIDVALPLTGNGANHPAWMKIIADVLGMPIRALPEVDASAIGAALIGAAAIGLSPDPERALPPPVIYRPDPAPQALYRERYGAFRDLYARVHVAD